MSSFLFLVFLLAECVSGQLCPAGTVQQCMCPGQMAPNALPSPAPTPATLMPSASPTGSPAASFTASPSASPTNNPTASPSASPTLSPSASPSVSPTKSPSVSPTHSPSKSPTKSPSVSPTTSPSSSPTNAPTTSPSSSPTNAPSASPTPPTQAPSDSPTSSPTLSPSTSPSVSPTNAPTRSPINFGVPQNGIGGCTSSAGDAFAFCVLRSAGCPPGSEFFHEQPLLGMVCDPFNDPSNSSVACCRRTCAPFQNTECGVLAANNPDAGVRCVAQGTCVSIFNGNPLGSSCGSSGCECCQSIGLSDPTPSPPEQSTQCQFPFNDAGAQEPCDGMDLKNETCASLGFGGGGTLACESDCSKFDTSNCVVHGACCTAVNTCIDDIPQTSCFGAFVPAGVCTPNLCVTTSFPSGIPQRQTQMSNIEFGTKTVGQRSRTTSGSCFLGTSGGLVESNGTRYVMSNAHVWAPAQGHEGPDFSLNLPAYVGMPVRELTSCNGGSLLGTLSDWTPLTPGQISEVDGAIALANEAVLNTQGVFMALGQVSDGPAWPHDLTLLGRTVIKSGRTTGITIGSVIGIHAFVNVADQDDDEIYVIGYDDQIIVEGLSPFDFSAGGDSGSGVFDLDTRRPVGLLFAGGGTDTILNPMQAVYTRFFPDDPDVHFVGFEDTERRKRSLTHDIISDAHNWRDISLVDEATEINARSDFRSTVHSIPSLLGHYVSYTKHDNKACVIVIVGNMKDLDESEQELPIDLVAHNAQHVQIMYKQHERIKAL